jgi:predicted DNA-binding transcriptional regulator YafY
VFLQPTRLLEKEALALLLISRTWDGVGPLGLARQARMAVDKVIQGLPPDLRSSVGNCAELLPELSEGEDLDDARDALFERVLAAATGRRQIRISYRERGNEAVEAVETTKLSLYRLPRIRGVWNLVGRSSFHRRVIMVPFPSIEKIEPTTDSYVIPPRFQLKRFLEQG